MAAGDHHAAIEAKVLHRPVEEWGWNLADMNHVEAGAAQPFPYSLCVSGTRGADVVTDCHRLATFP